MKSRRLAIAALIFITALTSCAKVEDATGPEASTAKEQETNVVAPRKGPVVGIKGKPAKHSIVVPPEIQTAWKSVVLGVKNYKTGSKDEIAVKIGSSASLDDLTITVDAFLPDFDMKDETRTITSKSVEAKNPAASLTIKGKNGKATTGWVFAEHADTHSFLYEKYEITLNKFIKN